MSNAIFSLIFHKKVITLQGLTNLWERVDYFMPNGVLSNNDLFLFFIFKSRKCGIFLSLLAKSL